MTKIISAKRLKINLVRGNNITMSTTQSTGKFVRYTLGILLLLLAINAFGGGIYGITGAKAIPTEWLKDSPFKNYFVPGIILFVCVGGSALLASILVFKQHFYARKATFLCGIIVLGWLTVQVTIIGYVSWMQPTIVVTALLILLLVRKLPMPSR